MTNENLAVISAIKSFKVERDIFKQVITNLINQDADENLIILLLNPDLVEKIIVSDKYTEALDYLMHTYQQERALIVKDRLLKSYEQKVQGAIEEAKISSIPTREAIESKELKEEEIKSASDSAKTFDDVSDPVSLEKEVPEVVEEVKEDLVNLNDAKNTAKKGAEEIEASINEDFEKVEEASKEFIEAHTEPRKATVEIPNVEVIPEHKEEPQKEEIQDPIIEEIKEEPQKEEIQDPIIEEIKEEPKEEKVYEVVKTRPVSDFFKRHKKAVMISAGLAMVAVTAATFSPIIAPSLIAANSILWKHVPFNAVKSLLHGINVALSKTCHAVYSEGSWVNAAGEVINAAAVKGNLLSALGTYGLFGVYGAGFVKAVKNMIKAADEPSKTAEVKEVKAEVIPEEKPIEIKEEKPIEIKEFKEPEVVEEVVAEPFKEEVVSNKKITSDDGLSEEDFDELLRKLKEDNEKRKAKLAEEEDLSVRRAKQ